MEYILTQEDIDRFGLIDAMAGDVATPADLQKMGMATGSPADQLARSAMDFSVPSMPMGEGTVVNQADRILTSPLSSDPMIGSEEIAADALTALGIGGNIRLADRVSPPTMPEKETAVTAPNAMMSLLDQPISQDPFENLSKNQRRMLAFAAIKDAGMALQGKEGTAFTGTLEGFRERADMERKRKATAARRQLMGNLMGGMGMGGAQGGLSPMQQRDAIMSALTGQLIDAPTANILLGNIERQESNMAGASKATAMIADIDKLLSLEGLDQIVGIKGIATAALDTLRLGALLPQAQVARGVLDKIKGGVFLNAFESLKGGGQITELEGKKAEEAGARLLTTQGPEDFRAALAELRFYTDIARRRSMGENIPPDTFYEPTTGAAGSLNERKQKWLQGG
jgi:hypothetical protein